MPAGGPGPASAVASGTARITGGAIGEGAGPSPGPPTSHPETPTVLAILTPPAPLRRQTRQLFTATVAVVGVGLAMGKRLGIA